MAERRLIVHKKILVIEDDASVRESLIELLQLLQYAVIAAENGSEGISQARTAMPDLIICDIMMPKVDGYDVLYELRKYPDTAAIPFIFLTAKTALPDIRKGMELGADDYLFKPFTMSDLTKSIDMRFAKRELLMGAYKEQNSASTQRLAIDAHIIMMCGNHPESVKVSKILYIEALEHYCQVYTSDGKKLLVRKSMREWDEQLPMEIFVRIHRSTIINLDHVEKFEKWFNNTFRVFIKGIEQPFEVSRRFGSRLRNMMHRG